MTLKELPNVGVVLEEKLKNVGVFSPETLEELGSKEAFVRLRLSDPTSCLSTLYALEGAVQGVRWHGLDPKTTLDLKTFFHTL